MTRQTICTTVSCSKNAITNRMEQTCKVKSVLVVVPIAAVRKQFAPLAGRFYFYSLSSRDFPSEMGKNVHLAAIQRAISLGQTMVGTRAATVCQHAITTGRPAKRGICAPVIPAGLYKYGDGPGARILTGRMARWWCVYLAVLLGGSRAATLSSPGDDTDNNVSKEQDEYLLKQVSFYLFLV